MTDAERRFKSERAGGNYSAGTKEMQEKKYIERKESERKRRELFYDALAMYKAGDLESVSFLSLMQRKGLGPVPEPRPWCKEADSYNGTLGYSKHERYTDIWCENSY